MKARASTVRAPRGDKLHDARSNQADFFFRETGLLMRTIGGDHFGPG
jgi:hypothetical protein